MMQRLVELTDIASFEARRLVAVLRGLDDQCSSENGADNEMQINVGYAVQQAESLKDRLGKIDTQLKQELKKSNK